VVKWKLDILLFGGTGTKDKFAAGSNREE